MKRVLSILDTNEQNTFFKGGKTPFINEAGRTPLEDAVHQRGMEVLSIDGRMPFVDEGG